MIKEMKKMCLYLAGIFIPIWWHCSQIHEFVPLAAAQLSYGKFNNCEYLLRPQLMAYKCGILCSTPLSRCSTEFYSQKSTSSYQFSWIQFEVRNEIHDCTTLQCFCYHKILKWNGIYGLTVDGNSGMFIVHSTHTDTCTWSNRQTSIDKNLA